MWATVHGVAKSWTQPRRLNSHLTRLSLPDSARVVVGIDLNGPIQEGTKQAHKGNHLTRQSGTLSVARAEPQVPGRCRQLKEFAGKQVPPHLPCVGKLPDFPVPLTLCWGFVET